MVIESISDRSINLSEVQLMVSIGFEMIENFFDYMCAFKDDHDRKMLPTESFKSSLSLFTPYLVQK